jgi:hypothetical protein
MLASPSSRAKSRASQGARPASDEERSESGPVLDWRLRRVFIGKLRTEKTLHWTESVGRHQRPPAFSIALRSARLEGVLRRRCCGAAPALRVRRGALQGARRTPRARRAVRDSGFEVFEAMISHRPLTDTTFQDRHDPAPMSLSRSRGGRRRRCWVRAETQRARRRDGMDLVHCHRGLSEASPMT